MDEMNEKLPIGPEEVAEAAQILQRYKAGKAALDKRLVDNELWFRMGHWKNYQNPMMEGKPQPSSGWLFNSIANKHADAMDNYPSPNVLPRAEDDEAAAQALSSVLPVVLEQADYEQVYSDTWWRKLKQGTGVKGVFWDPEQRGGVGEIAIRPMNLLMLYWEPGVDDIQASPHFFSLSLADTAQLESRWPQLAGHTASVLDVPHYIHDGGLDTSDKSVVVDWYYKKLSPEGRSVLHYCKFCNGVVLYASENDPALAERGFYDHGRYPFVFDALFMEEDSPAGFGYIDVMKECQTAIDKMNHAVADGGSAGQQPELPQQPYRGAEGDQRKPRHDPGRHRRRRDGSFGHRGLAGGGFEAQPGYAQERLQGICQRVLPYHRADEAVLRRGAHLPHHRQERRERVRPLFGLGAPRPACKSRGRRGAGQS